MVAAVVKTNIEELFNGGMAYACLLYQNFRKVFLRTVKSISGL